MRTYPKFIITDTGFFRYGMVNQHKNLLQPGENCWGGGFFEFDGVSQRMLLSGQSYDFGRPRWHYLDCLKVPVACRGLRLVYLADYSYDEDFDVSGYLDIIYVD